MSVVRHKVTLKTLEETTVQKVRVCRSRRNMCYLFLVWGFFSFWKGEDEIAKDYVEEEAERGAEG